MLLGFYMWFLYLWVCVAAGVSESTATLDDSVSEEEESSFDELADGTPYLQPGVELSLLNEVRDTKTCSQKKNKISFRLILFPDFEHVSKMFGHSSPTSLLASLEVILHARHRLSLNVIVCSYLPGRCAVDKLRAWRVRRGSLGPCDHGREGAGLQGRRCYPPPGRFPQGLVVGQGG